MDRRLAAILAADVVGYSRHMGQDEAGTVAALRALRTELIDPKITEHKGRVFKYTGDGVLAEFPSVVNAVACAVEIQRAVAARPAALPDNKVFQLRIGINLGDVIVEGGDLFGDGVNVAARLEGVASPGGVVVSDTVREHLGNRLSFQLEDMGEQMLKNIERPVRLHRLCLDGVPSSSQPALDLPDRPSIAVLPFSNMSNDPEQEYLADGLTEDIITGLSRVKSLFVIARNSTFTYKGQSVEVTQVARELGVRYVLEGSVRKSGRRVRISSQLVDATTGHHVWAEKFDREVIEIFELQDEITQNVVASTQTQIMLAEGSPLHRHNRPDISVWSLVTRAFAKIHELTHESLDEAKQLAEQALRIDPKCGPAWRCLSTATYHQAHMLAAVDYDAALSQALETAERSVRYDNNDEYAYWNLGNVLVALRQHDRAIAALQRAIEINPNYSTALGSLGTALCYVGRSLEGIARNHIAVRSDPLNPSIFFRFSGLALGYYLTNDYERAAEWAKRSVQRNRDWYLGHVYFTAALAQLNQIEEARSALREYLALFPKSRISDLERLPLKLASDLEHLWVGLRKAGLEQ